MEQLQQDSLPPYGAPPYGRAPYPSEAQYTPPGYGNGYGYAPQPPPKKRHTARTVVLSVLGVLVLLAGAAVVAGLVLDDGSQQELDAYLDGKGVSYHLPGDTAKVRLAVEPKYRTELEGVPAGTEVQVAFIERRHYEMGFIRMAALPGLQAADVGPALRDAAKAGAAAASVRIVAMRDARVDGFPAVRVDGKAKGDEVGYTVVYAAGNVYMLLVHAEDDGVRAQRELERSFTVGG